MKFAMRQNQDEYTIRRMECKKTNNGDYQLSWNYNKASHFLVVVHPAKITNEPEDRIVSWLEKNGTELLDHFTMTSEDFAWYLVQERDFCVKKNKFIIPRGCIRIGVPYCIGVYPCQISQEEWAIYGVPNKTNVAVISVSIPVEIRYKRLFFSGKRLCMFRPRFDSKQLDGILCYKPSCCHSRFPVSAESMRASREGWLEVRLPKGEELNLSVALEYREYYNVRIEED